MRKFMMASLLSILPLAGLPLVAGCDDTVERKESVDVKKDGTVVHERDETKRKPDGTVVREQERTVDR